jgi:SnoaL-like domain
MRTFDHNEMADFVAIQRLQASYADIVTRRQWSELEQIFVPEATVSIDMVAGAPFVLQTPAGIGEFIDRSIERFEFFEFVILNSVIEFGPAGSGHATARMYMAELRQDREGGRRSTAFGLYRDTYVKAGDDWLIAARKYRSAARTSAREFDVFGFDVSD